MSTPLVGALCTNLSTFLCARLHLLFSAIRPSRPLMASCMRNTEQVHESFGVLAPSRMYPLGGDGPDIPVVESSLSKVTP